MEQSNDSEALKITQSWIDTRRQLNDLTSKYYQGLSEIDRKRILNWLQENLSVIPITSKLKTLGLAKLVKGDYQYPPALLLIRRAMEALNSEGHFQF